MSYGDNVSMDVPEDILEMFENVPDTSDYEEIVRADFARFEKDPEWVAGYLKMQLVEDMLKAMKEQEVSKSDLAKRLGKSRQYVGRVLNERANFTLDSLAQIACALGLRIGARMYSKAERLAILPALTKPRPLEHFVKVDKPVPAVDGETDAEHFAA